MLQWVESHVSSRRCTPKYFLPEGFLKTFINLEWTYNVLTANRSIVKLRPPTRIIGRFNECRQSSYNQAFLPFLQNYFEFKSFHFYSMHIIKYITFGWSIAVVPDPYPYTILITHKFNRKWSLRHRKNWFFWNAFTLK